MIRGLRRRHWGWMVLLAITLPALFALALASRPDATPSAVLPPGIPGPAAVWTTGGEWVGVEGALVGRLRAVEAPDRRGLELELVGDPGYPDVLVYWCPSTTSHPSSLPDDAWLLGAIYDARTLSYFLPAEASGPVGRVALYSLGHGEVVGSAPVGSP